MMFEKMKISCFLLISLSFLTVSCSSGSSDSSDSSGRGKKNSTADSETPEMVASSDAEPIGAEMFDTFIQRFNTERSFQLSRVKFPIKVEVLEDGAEEPEIVEKMLGRYDWELLDFTYDSTCLTRPYDQYTQEICFRNDSAILKIRGIENGIYADYYFANEEDKWYLVGFTDTSL